MPELPEVETIKEDLRELVVGSRIEGAEVLDPALVEGLSPEEFARGFEGREVTGARRRAKHLILELDGERYAVFQLKIGGQLLLVPPAGEPRTALMLLLRLDEGRRLFLRDETGFTRARLLGSEGLEARLSEIGPEPFGEEFSVEFSVECLRRTVGSRRAQIKPLILDQKVVAGVGNIYADEILYDARLHPRRKANTLSEGEWQALHGSIRKNLADGVEHRGTTVRLYRDVRDRPGEHHYYLRVFEQHGRARERWRGRESVAGRYTSVPSASRRPAVTRSQS